VSGRHCGCCRAKAPETAEITKKIDMQEGGFTSSGSNVNDNRAWHLHTPSGTFGGVPNTGTDLTSGFNTYGIDSVPGKSTTWYVNGKESGVVTSAQTTIPNEPMNSHGLK
jgi:hypothetical protein